MLKTFTKGQKKLLKGLKTKYFHFIVMKRMSEMKAQRETEEEERKEKRKTTKDKKKRKRNISNRI